MRRYALIRLALVVAALVTTLIGIHLYNLRQLRQETFWHDLRLGPVNTQLVYETRVMPYVIDTEGACSVPSWLDRGLHISREGCEEGITPVEYGVQAAKTRSWRWNWLGGEGQGNTVAAAAAAAAPSKWETSLVPTDTDPFMHALTQCGKGSHMLCVIMDMSKGPFHRVSDPLKVLTEKTLAGGSNEDVVHLCGNSYKDCVIVPASSYELFTNRHFSPSFDDEQFKDLVEQSGYFFWQLEW